MDIKFLAQRFVDATVEKWGTDEGEVYEVLKTVHDSNQAADFEQEVFNLLSKDQKSSFSLSQGNVVSSILRDELSGSELTRAEDFYFRGEDTFRADRFSYFLSGLASLSDFSSIGSKIMLGAGVALFVGLGLYSVTAITIVGSALVVGMAVYGGIKIIKNGLEIVFSETDPELKENLADLGEGTGITLLSTPFLSSSVSMMKRVASLVQREGPAGVIKSIQLDHLIRGGKLTREQIEQMDTHFAEKVERHFPEAMAVDAGGRRVFVINPTEEERLAHQLGEANPLRVLGSAGGTSSTTMQNFWRLVRTRAETDASALMESGEVNPEVQEFRVFGLEGGLLVDFVRPGLWKPEIPVREISIILGRGKIRGELQFRMDMPSDRVVFKADLFRLRFENAEAPFTQVIGSECIGFCLPDSFYGAPYSSLGAGVTRETLKTLPTEEALRLAAQQLSDFEALVAQFFSVGGNN